MVVQEMPLLQALLREAINDGFVFDGLDHKSLFQQQY